MEELHAAKGGVDKSGSFTSIAIKCMVLSIRCLCIRNEKHSVLLWILGSDTTNMSAMQGHVDDRPKDTRNDAMSHLLLNCHRSANPCIHT